MLLITRVMSQYAKSILLKASMPPHIRSMQSVLPCLSDTTWVLKMLMHLLFADALWQGQLSDAGVLRGRVEGYLQLATFTDCSC